MPLKKNSVFTIHLGCSKNQVDAECILSELLASGFSIAEQADSAQYILVNTCGFIEPAKEESIDLILSQIESKK
ncbi:MAG TPA: 30S ribosomal protein S12 methylthiotransferase RimO, partial [Fibrobacter sp.]|nr:30S ribosomal protein S12 methylthiotransferase RimO [Fibrobacter sp.]